MNRGAQGPLGMWLRRAQGCTVFNARWEDPVTGLPTTDRGLPGVYHPPPNPPIRASGALRKHQLEGLDGVGAPLAGCGGFREQAALTEGFAKSAV
eukprot:11902892-Alexandrium_andersonii.AAC.1